MTEPPTPDGDIQLLRHAWFNDREVIGDARMNVLQAWHEAERHQEADPINGDCFFCCKECDPRHG